MQFKNEYHAVLTKGKEKFLLFCTFLKFFFQGLLRYNWQIKKYEVYIIIIWCVYILQKWNDHNKVI